MQYGNGIGDFTKIVLLKTFIYTSYLVWMTTIVFT